MEKREKKNNKDIAERVSKKELVEKY